MRIFSRGLGVRGVVLAGLVFIGAAATTTAQAIPQKEFDTLSDFYYSTEGSRWSGWGGNPWLNGEPCKWEGISCENIGGEDHVTGILLTGFLYNSNVSSCPTNENPITKVCDLPDLRPLTFLKRFYILPIQVFRLQGPFPNISGLSHLSMFRLDDQQLSGSFPDISGLSNLSYFDASRNQLSGSFPDISSLSNLSYFDASHNQLSGSLRGVSGLSDLWYFNASYNQLNGGFPDISSLFNLSYFDVSHNLLSGSLPDLSSLTDLQDFDVSFNILSGPLPAPPRALINSKLAFLCPNHFEMVNDAKHFWQNLAWTMATGGQWPNSSWWNARSDAGYPACTPN